MTEETREQWIRTESGHIQSAFAYTGIAQEEAERLAALMYDIDADEKTVTGLTPEERILQELLMIQGIDPATATLLARVMPRLDWSKLVTSSTRAAEYLGTTATTLYRNRLKGRVPAHVEVRAAEGERADTVTYSIARLLRIHQWQRAHPWPGGNVHKYPDIGEGD